jgi:hypothetical protein
MSLDFQVISPMLGEYEKETCDNRLGGEFHAGSHHEEIGGYHTWWYPRKDLPLSSENSLFRERPFKKLIPGQGSGR